MKIFCNDKIDAEIYRTLRAFAKESGIELKRAKNLRNDLFVPAADLSRAQIDRAQKFEALTVIDDLTTVAKSLDRLRRFTPTF